MRDAYQSTQAVPAETVNVYDSAGRVSQQTDPGGGVTVFDYSSIPGATKVTLPGNNTGARVVVDEYEAGRRIRSTDGYGTADAVTQRFEYDPVTGGVSKVVLESVSPERVVFEAEYDRAGNVVWVEDALDRRTTYSDYDGFGQPGQVTSPDGAVTVFDYDGSGNLEGTVTTGADSTSTSVSFDLDAAHPGEVDTMIDARGKVWDFGYDDNGYLVSVLDPEGNLSSSDVDEVGRIVWSRSPKGNVAGADPEGYTTHFVTNARGQVTSMVDPLDKPSSTVFDELGRPERVTNADNRVTQYHYDALGRVDVVTRPDLSTVQTQYWPDGSVKAQIDAAGAATQYGYDAVGRSATVTDPLGRAASFEYRADGSLWWRQDPGGSCPSGPGCVVYTSDVAGQMTTATYADPSTPDVVDVGYDARRGAGRRSRRRRGRRRSGSTGWGG